MQDASHGEELNRVGQEGEGSDDEAGFGEDDTAEFEPGQGVEDMLCMLEEGGALPDIEGLVQAEDAQVLCCAVLCCAAMVTVGLHCIDYCHTMKGLVKSSSYVNV